MSKKPVQQYIIEPKSAEEMFTDREEPRAAFWDVYDKIPQGEYDVIHYYGIGGIGKTTLLKQIQLEISKKFNDSHKMSIYYNFEKISQKRTSCSFFHVRLCCVIREPVFLFLTMHLKSG